MRRLYLILIFLLLSVNIYLFIDLKRIQKRISLQEKMLAEYKEKLQRYRLQKEVSNIRGLKFLREVSYKTMDKVGVEKLIQEKLQGELTVQDERILRKFGFLRSGEEVLTRLSALYVEQVQGMYDEETGKMLIVEGLPVSGNLQRMFLVHELTHALQDQHFNLQELSLHSDNNDRALAWLALIEGDATLVMFEYYRRHLRLLNVFWDLLTYISVDQSQFYSSPYYIRENLIFPYKWGVKFLTRRTWNQINEIYRNPPKSTEQIIHPEKYPLDEPIDVDIQEAIPGWKVIDTNTMGEFNIRVLLAIYLGEYESIAPSSGWGGDRWQVWEEPNTGNLKVVWHTVWDTTKDAEEFFHAFRKLVRKRYPAISHATLLRREKWVKLYW